MYTTREKRKFIKLICADLAIDYWKHDYHSFGCKRTSDKIKSCKTLHEAFLYAQGLYDGHTTIHPFINKKINEQSGISS